VAHRLLALVVLAAVASCGGRAAPSSECELPPLADTRPTVERFCDGLCILESRDGLGRPVRLECNGTSCQLFVDAVPTCRCDDVDWANTCSHGTPTCLATSGLFSFADYTYGECD
jgi:hypothetical protein